MLNNQKIAASFAFKNGATPTPVVITVPDANISYTVLFATGFGGPVPTTYFTLVKNNAAGPTPGNTVEVNARGSATPAGSYIVQAVATFPGFSPVTKLSTAFTVDADPSIPVDANSGFVGFGTPAPSDALT